ncbi:protein-disulfide isomerase [Streptomyces phaeoluteigriseus]
MSDFDAGKFKLQFVGATFLDNSLTGEGSKNALSALGAALDVGQEAFLEYKTALYSAKWHPEESDDKFKDDSYLIKVADTVPALKSNAKFQKAVKDGTFDRWALEMSKTFDASGVSGTPTLRMDGKALTAPGSENAPMTVADFNTALEAALKA